MLSTMADQPKEPPKEQIVDPWTAQAGEGEKKINYDKLIGRYILWIHDSTPCVVHAVQFGSERIEDSLLQRIEALTKKPPHHFLRRKVFFSHRYGNYLVIHV